MFRSIVIIVCILQCCAVVADGVGAANVVGYVQSDHRHGIHVNTLRDVTGEEAKLGRIVNSPCEGAVLRFYDGTEWRRVVSELGTDDQLHWFDQDTGDCADDYRVPEGQSIQYDVPDEAEAGLSFMGSVPERFLEKGDMAPLFSDGPSLNEIRSGRRLHRHTTFCCTPPYRPRQLLQYIGETGASHCVGEAPTKRGEGAPALRGEDASGTV